VDGRYVRIIETEEGLFVSALFPTTSGHEDARPLSRRERLLWRMFRRPPQSV
jgi:hypothetical protein